MLDYMLDAGLHVGPVMACSAHDQLRIPVALDAEHNPLAARFKLIKQLNCAPYRWQACSARFWLMPPQWAEDDDPLTDVRGLFEGYNCLRTPDDRAAAA